VRGWLGVQIQGITRTSPSSLGLDSEGGALVAESQPERRPKTAGLKVGDTILAVNGKSPVKDPRDLSLRSRGSCRARP
jgi:serine protease Do